MRLTEAVQCDFSPYPVYQLVENSSCKTKLVRINFFFRHNIKRRDQIRIYQNTVIKGMSRAKICTSRSE